MSSVWRKTLVYLGLVEEPDEHDELPERLEAERREAPPEAVADAGEAGAGRTNVRPLRIPEPGAPHVRAMAGSVHVVVVDVGRFEDAELIGERYRSGQPVLFDLGAVDRAVARRILDFVSGVTYALRGRLARAGTRAFLLVPDGVELPVEERRRLADLGFEV